MILYGMKSLGHDHTHAKTVNLVRVRLKKSSVNVFENRDVFRFRQSSAEFALGLTLIANIWFGQLLVTAVTCRETMACKTNTFTRKCLSRELADRLFFCRLGSPSSLIPKRF